MRIAWRSVFCFFFVTSLLLTRKRTAPRDVQRRPRVLHHQLEARHERPRGAPRTDGVHGVVAHNHNWVRM